MPQSRKQILEARRERNRQSARAHRERKEQEIAMLQAEVDELKEHNLLLQKQLHSALKGAGACTARAMLFSETPQNVIEPPAVCA